MERDLTSILSADAIEKISPALDWLDSQQATMRNLVIEWSELNSGSGNLDGLLAMEEKIGALVADMAVDFSTIGLAAEERVQADGSVKELEARRSIHLQGHGRGNRKVLMTGHTDTVFPIESAFQKVVELKNGDLNGPGVTDMKGGILVMLFAVKALERAGLADRISWSALLSPDEETGSIGSGPVLTRLAKESDIGLTYEPSMPDGTLAGERKGSGNFTLVVKGFAAHAGREFDRGKNAVVKVAAIIGDLAALSYQREELTVNAAVINGGVAPNIVPDMAQLRFNVRLKKLGDGDWFLKAVDEVLDRHREEGYEITLHGGINRPPKVITPANEALMDRIQALGAGLGLTISYVPTGGCCEGNNLAAAGLPNIDTLGVRGGNIHSDQEYLIPESLSERAKLSALILTAIATGAMDDIIEMKRAENATKQ